MQNFNNKNAMYDKEIHLREKWRQIEENNKNGRTRQGNKRYNWIIHR